MHQARTHQRWIATVARMIIILICIWVAWMILVWSLQHYLMFPRSMISRDRVLDQPPTGVESIWLDTPDGSRVEAWLIPGDGVTSDRPGPAVVFAHGNAELIDDNLDLQWLAEAGASVLLVEYRGYGRGSGSPSQARIVRDTRDFIEQLRTRPGIDPDRIAYLGRSIGTGVLAQVAKDTPPAAMAMIVPPARLDTMAWKFGAPPFLVRSPFRTDLAVVNLDMPILLLPRDRDEVVPAKHAGRLHELAPHSELVMLHGTHNMLDDDDEMRRERDSIRIFLEKHGVLDPATAAQP